MGFMDKAKKLAEQAQTKIDEVQKDFNAKQGGGGQQQSGGGAPQYDEHGRQQAPAAPADLPATQPGDLAEPKGDPLSAEPTSPSPAPAAQPADEPRATPTQGDPLLEETERKPPTPPSGGGLSSGDPLG